MVGKEETSAQALFEQPVIAGFGEPEVEELGVHDKLSYIELEANLGLSIYHKKARHKTIQDWA